MISILMPVFNEEKYIKEAIDSVLTQSYQDFELIIIDDGSTDNTYEIIQQYSKISSKIKIRHFQTNKGKNAALNIGFQLSIGEIILFLAGDDVLYQDSLEKRIAFAQNLEATFCNFHICDKDLNIVDIGFKGTYIYSWKQNKKDILYDNLIGGGVISLSRSMSNKIFPLPEELPFEDWWISFFALYYSDNVYGLELPLLKYRIHEGNAIGLKTEGKHSEDIYIKKTMKRQIVFYEVLLKYILSSYDTELKILEKPILISLKMKKKVSNNQLPLLNLSFLKYFGIRKYLRLVLISKNKSHIIKKMLNRTKNDD